jgi:hypothetical protein
MHDTMTHGIRTAPRRAWLIYGGAVGACTAIALSAPIVVGFGPGRVSSTFVGCLGALVIAHAVATRFGGVTRGSAAVWGVKSSAAASSVLVTLIAIVGYLFDPHSPRLTGNVVAPSKIVMGALGAVALTFVLLVTAQVLVATLVARPDASTDRPADHRFASDEPRWRQSLRAALALVEGSRKKALTLDERRWVGELVLDVMHDDTVPVGTHVAVRRIDEALGRDESRADVMRVLAEALERRSLA